MSGNADTDTEVVSYCESKQKVYRNGSIQKAMIPIQSTGYPQDRNKSCLKPK
jgi:hypothetical protein